MFLGRFPDAKDLKFSVLWCSSPDDRVMNFKCFWGRFSEAIKIGFECFWGRILSVIEYFPRQSIHTPALVFQIGGGAKNSPPLRHRRLRQNISVFDSKRCQRGYLIS